MKVLFLALIRFYRRTISPLRPLAAALFPPVPSMLWKQWKNTAREKGAGWRCVGFCAATHSTGRSPLSMILFLRTLP